MSLEGVCKNCTLQAEFGLWHLKASVVFLSLESGFVAAWILTSVQMDLYRHKRMYSSKEFAVQLEIGNSPRFV